MSVSRGGYFSRERDIVPSEDRQELEMSMLAGIMQPYIFPYLGYWNLVAAADKWYFFDLPRFARKSWIVRNRILHPDSNKEYSYVTVPVRRSQTGIPIKDVRVNNDERWRETIKGKLTVYKGLGAPHYSDVSGLVDSVLEYDDVYLVDLIERSFKAVCDYIGLNVDYSFVSRSGYKPEGDLDPGEWALSIVKQFGITGYINPVGGVELFDESKYRDDDIALRFLRPKLSPYPQGRRGSFVPGLSILDALMFMKPSNVLERAASDYEVLTFKEAVKCMKGS